MIDWILVGLIAVLLGFVFFLYLMVRRTVVNFREGMQGNGKRNR